MGIGAFRLWLMEASLAYTRALYLLRLIQDDDAVSLQQWILHGLPEEGFVRQEPQERVPGGSVLNFRAAFL